MKSRFIILSAVVMLVTILAVPNFALADVDLTMDNIWVSPASPKVGEQTTITFWGKNIGESALLNDSGICNYGFTIDDFNRNDQSLICPSPLPSIDPLWPGDLFSLAVVGSFDSIGNKLLNFKINSGSILPDQNENNNSITGTIGVVDDNTKRDLVIEDIEVLPAQPVVGQSTTITVKGRYIGDVVLNSAVGINNASFLFNNFKSENDSMVGVEPRPTVPTPLQSGQQFTFQYKGYFDVAGSKMLTFLIDNTNDLTETNESNNGYNKTIDVIVKETFDNNENNNAFGILPDDLIRLASDSAIYKVGSDGKKHLFVNGPTFWSHHFGTWEELKYNGKRVYVKIISQIIFDSISAGDNMVIKSGSKLIKFQNSPKIYIVFNDAKIKNITEQSALDMFSANWKNSLVTIQNGFESNYTRADDEFIDKDNDGLADEDEVRIYHSDPYTADVDHDGYNDGVEIFGGYDPNSTGKLEY